MLEKNNDIVLQRNSRVFLTLFWLIIFCQMTTFKFIWSIEPVVRILNIIILVFISVTSFKLLLSDKFNMKLWMYYFLPAFFIVVGLMLNIGRNLISNFALFGYIGAVFPWLLYISTPAAVKNKKFDYRVLWRYFYYFMLISMCISLIDYYLVVVLGMGFFTRMIETNTGTFTASYFSLFHMLWDGDVYYRFYASFPEPGTLAMWLIPVMIYAYLAKRYFGLVVFSVSMFLTGSLGGLVSLLILFLLVSIFNFQGTPKSKIIGAVMLFIISISAAFYYTNLLEMYDEKGASWTLRQENVYRTFSDIGGLVLRNPLGLDLQITTDQNLANSDYIGSNFMPALYFQNGGILAFCGYLFAISFMLIIAIKKLLGGHMIMEERVVYLSIVCLFPFIAQRTSIFEAGIYAFLFSPAILKDLNINGNKVET